MMISDVAGSCWPMRQMVHCGVLIVGTLAKAQ